MSVCLGCATEDAIASHQFGSIKENCICQVGKFPPPSRLPPLVCLLCPGLAGQLGELPGTTVTVTG